MRGGDFFGRRLSDWNGLGAADDVKSSNRIRLEVTTVFVLLSQGVFGSQDYNSRKHCGSGRSPRLIPLTQVDGSRVFLSPGAPEATIGPCQGGERSLALLTSRPMAIATPVAPNLEATRVNGTSLRSARS